MSWLKLLISLHLNVENVLDYVSTQVNEIFNIIVGVFGYFNLKILGVHSVALIEINTAIKKHILEYLFEDIVMK